jgi:hypothetical protein
VQEASAKLSALIIAKNGASTDAAVLPEAANRADASAYLSRSNVITDADGLKVSSSIFSGDARGDDEHADITLEKQDGGSDAERTLDTALQQELRAQVQSAVQEASAKLSALIFAKNGASTGAAVLPEAANRADASAYFSRSKVITDADGLEVSSSIFSDDASGDDEHEIYSQVHGRIHPEDAVEEEYKDFDSIFSGDNSSCSDGGGSDGVSVQAEYKEFDSIFDGSDSSQQQSQHSGAGLDELQATDSLFDSDDEFPVEQLRTARAASRVPALRTSFYHPAARDGPDKAQNTGAYAAIGSRATPANDTPAAAPVQSNSSRGRASRARATVRQPSASEWSTILSAFDSGSSTDGDSQISL